MRAMQTSSPIVYTWADVLSFVEFMYMKLQKIGTIDSVVGISRGGLIPAVLLADKLKKPLVTIDVKQYEEGKDARLKDIQVGEFSSLIKPFEKYVVVDDVFETGASMEAVIKKLEDQGVDNIVAFVMVNKKKPKPNSILKHRYMCGLNYTGEAWIVFPWQTQEFAHMMKEGKQ